MQPHVLPFPPEQMIKRSKYKNISSICSCLLFAVCCLLFMPACGKKGSPSLAEYEKPRPPSGVRAIHRESRIIILWEFPKAEAEKIKGFHVLKASTGDFEKIAFMEKTARSYTDFGVTPENEYRYKIVSESLKGMTNGSAELGFMLQPPPPPPKGLSFSVHDDAVTIRWESADETDRFYIYKSAARGQHPLNPLNTEPLRERVFSDTFDVSRAVFYTVRSATGSPIRDEGPPSKELVINPATFVPSSPQNLTALPAEGGVYLLWNEPPETWVTGYKIYRAGGSQEGYLLIGSSRAPSYIDRGNSMKKRSYRVTALGPSMEGPPAEIRDVVCEPPR